MKKCIICMGDYSEAQENCPYCGYSDRQAELDTGDLVDVLKPGTRLLDGRFIIGRVLSYSSDFSILYLAWDLLLSRRVVIREYFPYSLCNRAGTGDEVIPFGVKQKQDFEKGRGQFEEENRTLNGNQDISGIICIYRCFQENGTSYSVSEYLEGYTLRDRVLHARLYSEQAYDLFNRLLGIVEHLHRRGIMHLNLSPDSIYVLEGGRLKLIDFGEAKAEMYRSQRKMNLSILDQAYTAPEILRGESPDTAADMYSLGAIYRFMLSGSDRKKRPTGLASRIIRLLMTKKTKERPANTEELRSLL